MVRILYFFYFFFRYLSRFWVLLGWNNILILKLIVIYKKQKNGSRNENIILLQEERKKNYEENKNVKQFCLSSYENIIKFYYLLDNPSESEVRQSCCQEFQYLFSGIFMWFCSKKTVNISVIRVSFEKHPLSSILYVPYIWLI